MRPLLGMWSGSGGGPPDSTLDFGFEIPPSINGSPVAGGEITIDGGVTFGTYDSANYFLLLDGAQVEVGQGPFTIPTSWTGGFLRPRGVLRKGSQQASEVGDEIGPVVADFPDFAPPYHGGPVALGTASGADFANAFPWQNTNVFAQAVNLNGGGQVRLASHLGNYTARTVAVNFGATELAPMVLQGVNALFVPTNANIIGTRQNPWTVGGSLGGEVLKIGRANHIQIRDLNFVNCGVAIRFSAPIDDVLIEDVIISNARRGIENGHSSPETSATVTNAVIRNLQMPNGFAKQGIRFEYDSNNILVTGNSAEDPSIWDAKYQGPDGGCYGADIKGTAHNITFRYVHIYRCSSQQTDTDFWDGDGIAAQTGCKAFLIDQCLMQGHADGGVDLKGGTALEPHVVQDTILEFNTWNFKAWRFTNFIRVKSREPHKRGGTNAPHHIHFAVNPTQGSGYFRIENCSFCDDRTSGVAFITAFVGGISGPHTYVIEIINSTYSGGMDDVWSNVPNVTIIGAFAQGPVCNVAPTVVWEEENGDPADPAVGKYVRVVTSTSDWTAGVTSFDYRWRLDTDWVTFETGERMLITEAAVGKIIDCFVIGKHSNGFHEGAKISEPALPLLDLVIPGGYGFLEHSPQGTPLPALTAGGFADQERFEFALNTTAGDRVQSGGDLDGIMEVGATDTSFNDGSQEISVTMTDTEAEFDPITKPNITVLVFKEFDELTRLISWQPAGNRSGIGHFGNAAPIQDLPELLDELVTQGEVGQSIRILGGGPGYSNFGSLVITNTPEDLAHQIEIFGCNAGGVASGDTGKELEFDFTTKANEMSVAERYASINFNGFNKNSYTTKIIGSRTPWVPPAWCIFRTGTLGLSDWSDGVAYNGYMNLADANFAEGQQITYRALLPGTPHFEDGIAIHMGGELIRPTTMRASSNVSVVGGQNVFSKVDFPSAPDIFVRQITWTNSFNGNILFDFRNSSQFLKFHHLWIERWGRAAFLFDAISSNGSNHITLENMYCRNNQNVWWQDDTFGGGDPTPMTHHDMTFRHILSEGYSKDFVLAHGDSHDYLFEHILANSYWQDGDAYAKGFTLDGTAHSFRWYRCISMNTIDTTGASGAPKNGDGIVSERPCYDLELEECMFAGNCQGVDLKGLTDADAALGRSPVRVTRCVFVDNQNNQKIWGHGAEQDGDPSLINKAIDCIWHDPYKHATGGASTDNFELPPSSTARWIMEGGSVSMDCNFTHININNPRSRLKFIGTEFFNVDEIAGNLYADSSQGDAIFVDCEFDGVPVGVTDATIGIPTFALSASASTGNGVVINMGQWPAGIKKGQYALMALARRSVVSPSFTPVVPTWDGWELIHEGTVGTALSFSVWGRLMQGEMRGPWACGFGSLGGNTHLLGLTVFNSVLRAGQAWEALVTGADVTPAIIWPGFTTLGPNRMAVHLGGFGNDAARGTAPAGWTERLSQGSGAGSDAGLVVDTKAIVSAGAQAAESRSHTNPNWVAVGIALKPAIS